MILDSCWEKKKNKMASFPNFVHFLSAHVSVQFNFLLKSALQKIKWFFNMFILQILILTKFYKWLDDSSCKYLDISVFNNLHFLQIYVFKLENKLSSDIQNFQRRQNKQKIFKAFEININENFKSINNLIRR